MGWPMRIRWLYFSFLPMLVSACLTSRNAKAIEEYRSPINEFDRQLDGTGNHRILAGKMTVQDGKARLQFDTVLLGSGRYLNVESTVQGMRFFETRDRLDGGKTVFLVQQNACCMDDGAFRRILFLKPGEKASASEILNQYYGYKAQPQDYPSALLVMDFTNIYTFTAMQAFWQSPEGVGYFVQAPSTDYNVVMEQIEWRQRSRLTLAAMYGWYAITVPVDIVTSPFQLIGMYLLGKGSVR
ncbi:MAG: hypothetical protein ACOY5B_13870 [Spirochaetota bacterium]